MHAQNRAWSNSKTISRVKRSTRCLGEGYRISASSCVLHPRPFYILKYPSPCNRTTRHFFKDYVRKYLNCHAPYSPSIVPCELARKSAIENYLTTINHCLTLLKLSIVFCSGKSQYLKLSYDYLPLLNKFQCFNAIMKIRLRFRQQWFLGQKRCAFCLKRPISKRNCLSRKNISSRGKFMHTKNERCLVQATHFASRNSTPPVFFLRVRLVSGHRSCMRRNLRGEKNAIGEPISRGYNSERNNCESLATMEKFLLDPCHSRVMKMNKNARSS